MNATMWQRLGKFSCKLLLAPSSFGLLISFAVCSLHLSALIEIRCMKSAITAECLSKASLKIMAISIHIVLFEKAC